MSAAYITRVGAFLPNTPVGNDAMESVLGQIGDRPSRARRIILRKNGIRSRHYAIDPRTRSATHTGAQLAAEAVRRLGDGAFALDEIDCLAAGTSLADQLLPGHASMVQGELGAAPCEIVSTAGVCVSGMSALKFAYLGVCAGAYRRAVACASEVASAILRAEAFPPPTAETPDRLGALARRPELAFEQDFLRWMLSDGAGAVLLEPEPRRDRSSLRVDWIDIKSYANEMEPCMYAGAEKAADGTLRGWLAHTPEQRAHGSVMAIKQDVRLLNEKVVHYTAERALTELAARRALIPQQIDYFLPHYSSAYFRDPLDEAMRKASFHIPQDRWFTNLATCGNTGSASIYIMLEELWRQGELRQGERILCYVPESGRFSVAYALLTVV